MKRNPKYYKGLVENMYQDEANMFGSYFGQYGGTRKVVSRDHSGEYITTSKRPNINIRRAKEKFYKTLNIDKETRQAINIYNQVKGYSLVS